MSIRDESYARELDAADPLSGFRDRFHIPKRTDGSDVVYLCGNSLGLMPKAARDVLNQELDGWRDLAVEGHFHGRRPWYAYHEQLREAGARLVGARPHEVVFMNGLTVNLHVMMVTFFRPTAARNRILIEDCAFPSDLYAAQTQLRHHAIDPAGGMLRTAPRPGESLHRAEDIEELLRREGERIAVVLLPGVNYFTGQVFDIERITAAAHRAGCVVGWDMAHAVGNIELRLHDWNVDFAVWCSYKYLNAGPGAVAGCFVHERHARDVSLPRFGGWWGNDPTTRFRMHLEPEFKPVPSADAWQLSNPPILSMAPLIASLAVFDEAGMPALREKSRRLTGYLQELLDAELGERVQTVTPRDPASRGCQLSLQVNDAPRELLRRLNEAGVVCDFREPDIIRVAPVPLYNGYQDAWQFVRALAHAV
ncbi:MAG: kynureninase [Phycisphaerae bacterium]|nr:kynureninase [Phycisphaerae bacterium]